MNLPQCESLMFKTDRCTTWCAVYSRIAQHI